MSFDIVSVSDFRLPGGSNVSIAEEIKAQASAGYTTGLVHIPVYDRNHPINPKIRACIDAGLATLVEDGTHVMTRLLTIRPPKVAEELHPQLATISAATTLVVVNQPARDRTSPTPYYDVAKVTRTLRRAVGRNITWAPIGPLARSGMIEHEATLNLLEWDWSNLIDVDAWAIERNAFVSDIPVIGRHSRPDWRKWPETPRTVLEAYPNADDCRVVVLGGRKIIQNLLGRIPPNWTVYPFDAIPAQAFLSQIDFYVYFHHSGWQEAFGRGILEAISAGAVVILPHHFQALFGDSCLYAQPAEVRGIVQRLYQDFAAYQEQSRTGVDYARNNFSYAVHVRRLQRLIGAPGVAKIPDSNGLATLTAVAASRANDEVARTGNVTRLKSFARRLTGAP
jgi:hypothetical protein